MGCFLYDLYMRYQQHPLTEEVKFSITPNGCINRPVRDIFEMDASELFVDLKYQGITKAMFN